MKRTKTYIYTADIRFPFSNATVNTAIENTLIMIHTNSEMIIYIYIV